MSLSWQELAVALPAPILYFPVSEAGGVMPSQPLAARGQVPDLELDSERSLYLAHKRAILERQGRGPFRAVQALAQASQHAERYLRNRMSQLAFADEARLRQLDLDALMLELQEDLVIMLLPAGFSAERARAIYLHVCFPSGWDPARMLGKSFVSLHARVPREPGFERADYKGHAAGLFESPALRFVWSVTPDAQLDHHPELARASWHDATEGFLRVERQVAVPLGQVAPDGAALSLFLIRTYVYPLCRLDSSQRSTLARAVQTMSEPMRRYKGMLGHEARIQELIARPVG